MAKQFDRVLARLMTQRLVLRVESLAAYMLLRTQCDVCLICDGWNMIQLLPHPELAACLAERARRLGFVPARLIIESHGYCTECAGAL